jgi:hypothetical protein
VTDETPGVDRTDLLSASMTVRSFDDLSSPPADLPERSTGLTFAPDSGEDGDDATALDADVTYDLVPSAALEHVAEFAGQQLSFEFAIPGAVEDAVASHLTAPEAPWNQPRYVDPAADISDPGHRGVLADRYDAIGDPAPSNTLVALRDVPGGEHRLTANGAELAPHSETVDVGGSGDTAIETGTAAEADPESGGVTTAGAGAEIPLVAGGDATKLVVDPADSDDELTDLAVEDDFAGRLYDAPLSGPDAVYVHRGGAYTTEVRDADDAVGAFRVDPAAVAATLDEEGDSDDTGDDGPGEGQGGGQDEDGGDGGPGNAVRGLAQALAAIVEAARRAAERAESGDRGQADTNLDAVATRLGLARAADNRFAQLDRRAEQAKNAEKL